MLSARPLRPDDIEAVLELWDLHGGWHRATTPIHRGDVERTLRRLVTPRRTMLLPAPPTRDAAWLEPAVDNPPEGVLYARDDEESDAYVTPLHPADEGETEHVNGLLGSAAAWFQNRDVTNFLVEVPSERQALRALFANRGVVLWTRVVFDRPLVRAERVAPQAGIRPLRPAESRPVIELFRRRFPGGPPPAVPIPFFDPRTPAWWAPATEVLRSRIWVLDHGGIVGVAGVTTSMVAPVASIGPFLLDFSLNVADGEGLLLAALASVESRRATRVRLSLPSHASTEIASAHAAGFQELARGELFRVRV